MMDLMGHSRGIILFWKKINTVHLISCSICHINIEVLEADNSEWRLTSFYGHYGSPLRRQSWKLIRSLRVKSASLWTVVGDLNDILFATKKKIVEFLNRSGNLMVFN